MLFNVERVELIQLTEVSLKPRDHDVGETTPLPRYTNHHALFPVTYTDVCFHDNRFCMLTFPDGQPSQISAQFEKNKQR
jgi:hypothetical protein